MQYAIRLALDSLALDKRFEYDTSVEFFELHDVRIPERNDIMVFAWSINKSGWPMFRFPSPGTLKEMKYLAHLERKSLGGGSSYYEKKYFCLEINK